MSPNDSHKEKNENEERHKCIVKYKLKYDIKVKYCWWLFRIYKWTDTFTTMSDSRFTDKVVNIKKVELINPHTYLLENLNGDEIKVSFY